MQQPPYYPPPAAPAPGAMAMPRKNGMAIAALICSLVGLIPCTFCIPSLLGIIFGIVGMSKASKAGTGKGMSLAGLVIGIAGIGVFALAARGFYGALAGPVAEVDPAAEKYFKLVSEEKYDEAYKMTSPGFKMKRSAEEFETYYKDIKDRFGEYQKKDVNILAGSAVNVNYSNTGSTVSIVYLVEFGKVKQARRTVVFQKSGNDWLIHEDDIR